MKFNIPKEVIDIAQTLHKSGFQAYLVGGCARDLLLNREPKDWDIATDARPEEIQKVFPESVYENNFGTVGVKISQISSFNTFRMTPSGVEESNLKSQNYNSRLRQDFCGQAKLKNNEIVEVTTFRKEGKYTDKRHPDEIRFAKTIEEDLSRRDFTVNAIAAEFPIPNSQFPKLVDPFNGQKDLKNKIIRAVGNADERLEEDALRLMRAVRFASELNFAIEEKTVLAIRKRAVLLEMIAKERIRDEFIKIIMSNGAMRGVEMLEDFGLLRFIIPELREGIGCDQDKHHIYTVWEHNLRALDYTVRKNYSLEVRLAALLHDVGKPKTKRGERPRATFYGHDIVGAKITARIMDRLRFSNDVAEKVIHLVRYHLFYYNVGEVSEAGVRRFISRVGVESIDDIMKVREADRIGSGVPKAFPYKLRHLKFMIEKVRRDPVSPKMLAVGGEDVMRILGISSGPRVGWILAVLLDEVLEDPKKNTKENLELRIQNLGKLSDSELEKFSKQARNRKDEFEEGVEDEMKKKYYVQ